MKFGSGLLLSGFYVCAVNAIDLSNAAGLVHAEIHVFPKQSQSQNRSRANLPP